MKVTNDPADGIERENWASVFPSRAIATAAAITVSGAAIPAVVTIVAKPKKKLIAGAMLASVAAAMSKLERTPRARRAGAGLGAPSGREADASRVDMSALYPFLYAVWR